MTQKEIDVITRVVGEEAIRESVDIQNVTESLTFILISRKRLKPTR